MVHHIPGSERIASGVRDGFTLVEILTVVSILALLLTVTVPGVTMARRAARQMTCLNNQRQIVMATIGYTCDHMGYLPYGVMTRRDNMPWNISINDYVSSDAEVVTKGTTTARKFFACPEDGRPWSSDVATAPRTYYGVNRYDTGLGSGWARMDNDATYSRSLNLRQFAHPLTTVLYGEYAFSATATIAASLETSRVGSGFQSSSNQCVTDAPYARYEGLPLMHGSRLVYGMADGHAEALAPKVVASTAVTYYWRPTAAR